MAHLLRLLQSGVNMQLARRCAQVVLADPQGEDLYAGCMVAMAELLLSGCTTASDHHYFYTNGMMCVCWGRSTTRSCRWAQLSHIRQSAPLACPVM